ncbi:transcriptional regulator ATRX isoform X2 [Periplaneta americana]|uniref:transcriptional regulator ATRX isoform X2 n=1 Tax=Periplaneta americana TaxID=6978 RepID=UPI0037E7CE5F
MNREESSRMKSRNNAWSKISSEVNSKTTFNLEDSLSDSSDESFEQYWRLRKEEFTRKMNRYKHKSTPNSELHALDSAVCCEVTISSSDLGSDSTVENCARAGVKKEPEDVSNDMINRATLNSTRRKGQRLEKEQVIMVHCCDNDECTEITSNKSDKVRARKNYWGTSSEKESRSDARSKMILSQVNSKTTFNLEDSLSDSSDENFEQYWRLRKEEFIRKMNRYKHKSTSNSELHALDSAFCSEVTISSSDLGSESTVENYARAGVKKEPEDVSDDKNNRATLNSTRHEGRRLEKEQVLMVHSCDSDECTEIKLGEESEVNVNGKHMKKSRKNADVMIINNDSDKVRARKNYFGTSSEKESRSNARSEMKSSQVNSKTTFNLKDTLSDSSDESFEQYQRLRKKEFTGQRNRYRHKSTPNSELHTLDSAVCCEVTISSSDLGSDSTVENDARAGVKKEPEDVSNDTNNRATLNSTRRIRRRLEKEQDIMVHSCDSDECTEIKLGEESKVKIDSKPMKKTQNNTDVMIINNNSDKVRVRKSYGTISSKKESRSNARSKMKSSQVNSKTTFNLKDTLSDSSDESFEQYWRLRKKEFTGQRNRYSHKSTPNSELHTLDSAVCSEVTISSSDLGSDSTVENYGRAGVKKEPEDVSNDTNDTKVKIDSKPMKKTRNNTDVMIINNNSEKVRVRKNYGRISSKKESRSNARSKIRSSHQVNSKTVLCIEDTLSDSANHSVEQYRKLRKKEFTGQRNRYRHKSTPNSELHTLDSAVCSEVTISSSDLGSDSTVENYARAGVKKEPEDVSNDKNNRVTLNSTKCKRQRLEKEQDMMVHCCDSDEYTEIKLGEESKVKVDGNHVKKTRNNSDVMIINSDSDKVKVNKNYGRIISNQESRSNACSKITSSHQVNSKTLFCLEDTLSDSSDDCVERHRRLRKKLFTRKKNRYRHKSTSNSDLHALFGVICSEVTISGSDLNSDSTVENCARAGVKKEAEDVSKDRNNRVILNCTGLGKEQIIMVPSCDNDECTEIKLKEESEVKVKSKHMKKIQNSTDVMIINSDSDKAGISTTYRKISSKKKSKSNVCSKRISNCKVNSKKICCLEDTLSDSSDVTFEHYQRLRKNEFTRKRNRCRQKSAPNSEFHALNSAICSEVTISGSDLNSDSTVENCARTEVKKEPELLGVYDMPVTGIKTHNINIMLNSSDVLASKRYDQSDSGVTEESKELNKCKLTSMSEVNSRNVTVCNVVILSGSDLNNDGTIGIDISANVEEEQMVLDIDSEETDMMDCRGPEHFQSCGESDRNKAKKRKAFNICKLTPKPKNATDGPLKILSGSEMNSDSSNDITEKVLHYKRARMDVIMISSDSSTSSSPIRETHDELDKIDDPVDSDAKSDTTVVVHYPPVELGKTDLEPIDGELDLAGDIDTSFDLPPLRPEKEDTSHNMRTSSPDLCEVLAGDIDTSFDLPPLHPEKEDTSHNVRTSSPDLCEVASEKGMDFIELLSDSDGRSNDVETYFSSVNFKRAQEIGTSDVDNHVSATELRKAQKSDHDLSKSESSDEEEYKDSRAGTSGISRKSNQLSLNTSENGSPKVRRKRKQKLSDEEKELKKAEKIQKRELKLAEQAKNKAEKLAAAEALRSKKPGECLKYIRACLDQQLLATEYGGELLVSLQSEGMQYNVQSNPVPFSVFWIREIQEHSVGEDKEVHVESREQEEDQVLVVWHWDKVLKLIFAKDLMNQVLSIQRIVPHKKLTLIIYGVESYFRLEKQKREQDKFSWYAAGDSRDCVRVDKNGNGLLRLWQQQLSQFNRVGMETAQAITAVYRSPSALLEAYENCGSQKEAELLLESIPIRRGVGPLATTKKVGPDLSKKVHAFLTAVDGDAPLSQKK